MSTALILAGHGSHISPNTAGLVWQQVDQLRSLGIADEVTAAFWKEMPSFHTVFNSLAADHITVIPLFTARGYFTQTVIPAEMGLTGTITERGGRVIRYARTLGEHPNLTSILLARVDATLREYNLPPDQTAVAVIGHSTRRNPESRQATETQAQAIRDARALAQVEAVYLDDSPSIPEIYARTTARHLIAVPYFLAPGSHTTIDVPAELGLPPNATRARVAGREVYYTDPVGTDRELTLMILSLAQEAGALLYPETTPTHPWSGFPQVGNAELIDRVAAAPSYPFGGLNLSLTAVHAWGDPDPRDPITTPAELRDRVRATTPFRSLATADDLPRGWHVPLNSPAELPAIVETIYPGILGDWKHGQPCPLHAVIERQTGMYRQLAGLSSDRQAAVVERVCGRCIRFPVWYESGRSSSLPCPEPCNQWLSTALEELS